MARKPGPTLDALRRTFGDQSVDTAARRDRVGALFDRIAPRYDLMNDLMSFGTHRLWKRKVVDMFAEAVGPVEGPLVDLAGGTGDLALRLARRLPGRAITVADASQGMLAVARARAHGAFDIVHAEAENLPFAEDSLAGVTLAFGLRNFADPVQALAGIARSLKPGGVFALLEFSRAAPWFAPLYALHSRYVIPLLGVAVARDREAYRYLVESIRIFPDATTVSAELEAAGLRVRRVRTFMFGVAALHLAIRDEDDDKTP